MKITIEGESLEEIRDAIEHVMPMCPTDSPPDVGFGQALVTLECMRALFQFIARDEKIQAIKHLRGMFTGLTLKESKVMLDVVFKTRP